MENVKIYIDGILKDVYGLFYVFESKYYFIYTEKEVDENNYVILYLTQVGKETNNTENGPIDTGYMVGVEIVNPEEQQKAQAAISYIVDDKKNNTTNPQIQYLPMSMLSNLKIISKKRFRLLKSIMVDNFKLQFDESVQDINSPIITTKEIAPSIETANQIMENINSENTTSTTPVESANPSTNSTLNDSNVIIDYRSKYFEEEQKNKELQSQIEELTQKLNEIKKVIE